MSDRHLSTDSQDVPLTPGKLRLYSMRFCPYAQRVHLVLDAKEIPYDTVWINLIKKPEWFLEKFPRGLVPALDLDGTPLFESLVISDYLDEKYAEPKLHSTDPLRKAQDRLLVDSFCKLGPVFRQTCQELTTRIELFEECLRVLDPIEKELGARGTAFLSGEKPGMLDYMIWPWMERMEMFRVFGGEGFALPKNRLSKLAAWTAVMKNDAAVMKNYITPEKYVEFYKLYLQGDVKCYDVLKL